METTTTITEIPIPFGETSPNGFLAWMDWRGPDVLRLLHEGTVDVIHWNITDSERFEKVKHGKDNRGGQRVLCVTGPCPLDGEAVAQPLPRKSWGTRTVHVDPKGPVLRFFGDVYRPPAVSGTRHDVGDRVYVERDKDNPAVVWVGNADPREAWGAEVSRGQLDPT